MDSPIRFGFTGASQIIRYGLLDELEILQPALQKNARISHL